MLFLQNLKNEEILVNTKRLVGEERRIQIELLHHLREIEKRKLFLEIGFGSLFDYVVRELGYSESAAYRRIQAMRLLRDVPVIEDKIADGSLTLTTAAQVQSFLKAESKRNTSISVEDKLELIQDIENKSSREVEKYLLSMRPEGETASEKVRTISENLVELRFVLSEKFKDKLDRMRLLLSHVNPNFSNVELIEHLLDNALSRFDPEPKKSKSSSRPPPARAKQHRRRKWKKTNLSVNKIIKNARHIPAHIRKSHLEAGSRMLYVCRF